MIRMKQTNAILSLADSCYAATGFLTEGPHMKYGLLCGFGCREEWAMNFSSEEKYYTLINKIIGKK